MWQVLEILLLAITFAPSEDDSGAPLIQPVALFISGGIVVGPCVAATIVIIQLFRWGNKGRRQRPKRERAAASELDARKRGPGEKYASRIEGS